MLPPKTSYKIGSTQAGAAKIFSLRLPEDLAAKILTAGDVKLQLQLDPNNPTENVHHDSSTTYVYLSLLIA